MTTELETFTDYCLSFYGEDGIYADDFVGGPLAREEIIDATSLVLAKCEDDSVDNYTWGGGDSVDRERVREEVEQARRVTRAAIVEREYSVSVDGTSMTLSASGSDPGSALALAQTYREINPNAVVVITFCPLSKSAFEKVSL